MDPVGGVLNVTPDARDPRVTTAGTPCTPLHHPPTPLTHPTQYPQSSGDWWRQVVTRGGWVWIPNRSKAAAGRCLRIVAVIWRFFWNISQAKKIGITKRGSTALTTTSGFTLRINARISSSSAAFTSAAENRASLTRLTASSARDRVRSATTICEMRPPLLGAGEKVSSHPKPLCAGFSER